MSAIILVGRILLSIMFIVAGFGKLTAIGGTAGYFGSLGIPAPTVVAVLVGLLELLGGLAVLVGFRTHAAAGAVAVFTVAASLLAHMDWSDGMPLMIFQKNLAVAGGFLILAAFGPGALSVDAKR